MGESYLSLFQEKRIRKSVSRNWKRKKGKERNFFTFHGTQISLSR